MMRKQNSPKSKNEQALRTAPITPAEERAVLEAMRAIAPGVAYEWVSSRASDGNSWGG